MRHFFNGKAAYEYIAENEVDVVLSDIQMPIMDGLMLIEKTMSYNPEIKFIFLSNFDNFSMVKRAFQFGACDYILKADFSMENFSKVFFDVTKKMKTVRENPAGNYALKEHALREYFWGGISAKIDQVPLRINIQKTLVVSVLKLLDYENVLNTQWNSERENMKYGLSNCIDEILETCGNGEFFFNGYDEIIFMFSVNNPGEITFDTASLFDKITHVLNTHFELNVSVGIYDSTDECTIKDQYLRVRDCLKYSFLLGINRLISAKEISTYEDAFDIRAYTLKTKALIKSFGFRELCTELESVPALRPPIQYIDLLTKFYRNIIMEIRDVYDEFLIDASGQRLFGMSVDCCSVDTLNEYLEEATQYFMAQLATSDIAVMKIQNYVYENYAENITLQFLAEKFSFDYAGLSRRFQKVAGTTFPKFLNEVRLNEAMKLIRITDHKISSIASMVGYNNYESFSRNFKKKFKRWPNEIRKEGTYDKEGI